MMNYKLEGEEIFKKISLNLKQLFIPSQENDYSPRFLKSNVVLCLVVVLLVARIVTLGIAMPFPHNVFFADITKIDLLNLLNQDRQNLGLNTLQENSKLDQAAMEKAQDMVANNYFAHQSPQGLTPWHWFNQVGYAYKYAGENLAVGFIDSNQVFDAWLNSPGHRANLQNPNYKDVGTAIVSGFGGNNTMIVVQVFGSLQPTKTVTATQTPVKTVATAPTPKPQVAKPAPTTPILVSPEPDNQAAVTAQTPLPEATQISATPVPPVQRVLGKSIQINQLEKITPNSSNNAYLGFVNFMVYDSEKLISWGAYLLLITVGFALVLNIGINFNVQRQQLILKSLVMLAILFATVSLNKNVVNALIPHQVNIQAHEQ